MGSLKAIGAILLGLAFVIAINVFAYYAGKFGVTQEELTATWLENEGEQWDFYDLYLGFNIAGGFLIFGGAVIAKGLLLRLITALGIIGGVCLIVVANSRGFDSDIRLLFNVMGAVYLFISIVIAMVLIVWTITKRRYRPAGIDNWK